MTTVFWDSHGVILIDYRQKEKNLTVAYYASLLDMLKAEISEKRYTFAEEMTIAMAKINELRFELLQHPPDLTPSDFSLFPKLIITHGGQKFSSPS